jgi:hypothetical protein
MPFTVIAATLELCLFLDWNLNADNALFHTDRVARCAGFLASRFDYRAIVQTHSPCVQWANNYGACDNTVTQGTTAMRAAVFDGKEALAKIEERDLVAIDFDATALTEGNIFCLRNAYPTGMRDLGFRAHNATVSMG